MAKKSRIVISDKDAKTIVLSSIIAISMSAVYDFFKSSLIEFFPQVPLLVPVIIALLVSLLVMLLPFRLIWKEGITEK